MRTAAVVASLFAIASLGQVPDALAASSPTEPVAGASDRAPAAEVRDERGFPPRGEYGERHEGEEREEHGERREFRERREPEGEGEPERGFGGSEIIVPGYPYGEYDEEPPEEYEEPPYAEPPEEPRYLLYCEDPPGYYPNVTDCPTGWEEVPADDDDQ